MIRKFRTRVMLLALVAVAPGFALAVYTALAQRQAATEEARADALRLVRLATSQQQQVIEATQSLLVAVSEVVALKGPASPECTQLLREIMTEYPLYANLGVATAKGNIVSSGLTIDSAVPAQDRPWYRRALESRAFAIGDYQIGRITHKPTLNVANPVLDNRGELVAVVFAAVDLRWLDSLARQASLPEGASLVACDSGGTVFLCIPEDENAIGRPLTDECLLGILRSDTAGVTEMRDGRDTECLVAFARLSNEQKGTALHVSVRVPKAAIYAKADALLLRSLVVLVLAILIAFISAWFAAELLFLRKIRLLTKATERLKAGDLAARSGLAHDGRGDLQGLARAFDAMAESVERETKKRAEIESELRLIQVAALAVGEAPDLPSALGVVLRAVCKSAGWACGEAWVPDADGRLPSGTAASYAADEIKCTAQADAKVLGQSSREVADSVLRTRSPVLLSAGDPDFPSALRTQARQLGVTRVVGMPITTDAGVVAELVFFLRDSDLQIEEGMRMASTLASQLGAVIRRRQTEDDLRRSETQLRQAQKMEAVGQLAGGVAHDFNNILTAIIGYSEFLNDAVAANSAQTDMVLEIRKAADRAASLTRQLLAFSRKQVLQPKILDLNTVVTDVDKMLRRLIGEDIDLVLERAAKLGAVSADPGQLEQLLMNLVVNARDAMPDGGTLTIRTANVDVDEAYAATYDGIAPGQYVQFTVSDTGCGMDARTKARIFEPFFTTKEPGKGTGLGLSTVYGIVKQSGGHVTVYSEPGKGTTFRVYLPRVEQADTAEHDASVKTSAGSHGTGTVLLAEDDDTIRPLTERILKHYSYTVLVASNADEAVALAQSHTGAIDLLLTDVVMPGASGKALADRLRQLRADIPVLYMSGYNDSIIGRHGVLDAGVHFLPKPFTMDELLEKVREVIDVARGKLG